MMISYFRDVLTSQGSFGFFALLASAAVKATLLLAFAALLCFAFRRFSAATRHLLWASALCASLVLPFLSFIQVWEAPILPARISALGSPGAQESNVNDEAREAAEARTSTGSLNSFEANAGLQKKSEFRKNAEFLEAPSLALSTSEPASASQKRTSSFLPRLLNWASAVWAIGVLLLLFRLLIGFAAANLLTRRAAEFEDASLTNLFSSLLAEVGLNGNVRLLRSERTLMPIVYGVLRPAVLLPAGAEEWSEERRRMVLLHELTHITRRDCLTQMMAQAACALYWFNPLIWYAARRLRVEREQACDDYVLRIGAKPSVYANHLLEIARSMQERSIFKWSQTTSVAMARRSQLEGRLLAILSKENKRVGVSRAVTVSLMALLCVLFLTLATVRPTIIHAQNPRTSVAASNDEKENLEGALPDSLPVAGSQQSDDTPSRGAEAREADGKLVDTTAAVNSSQGLDLNEGRIGGETGRNITGEVERNAEQKVDEAAARQTTTADVQIPEAAHLLNREANSFINAGYQQDGKAQTQNRAGDFIDEMASVGYTNLSVDELIRLKSAGVTADDVRSLRALGFANLTTKELASLRMHGVTRAYVQAIRAAGYNDLSVRELTNFRMHAVTPEYIKTLRDAGYGNLSAKQLIEFKIHSVTPAFIGAIRAAGYSNVSPKEMVSLRIHGITPDFIRTARSRLGELTLKQLISVKSMGIIDDANKNKDKDKE